MCISVQLSLFISFIISLFTSYDDNVYVTCYKDANVHYVYDASQQLYKYEDGNYIRLNNAVNIVKKPALSFLVVDNVQYSIRECAPQCFDATFEEVCCFITAKVNDGFSITEVLCTPKIYECNLCLDDIVLRVIYTSDNKLRIYSKDPDRFPISDYI